MDPASIISILGVACSAAKGAIVVGTAIYKFQRDVRDYDDKAEGFADEIKALGGACEAVGQRLEAVLKDGGKLSQSGDQSEKLWMCLKIQLEACQKTVDGLQEALNDAILSNGDKSVWNRILKQLLLYLHVFDIEEARERIRSHTASLQIILLSIGIEMTYLLPGRIDQHLQQEFQKQLKILKEELSDLLRKRADDDSKNEDAIISATRYVITSGETLYEQSIAGGSIRGDVPPFTGNTLVKQWLELQEYHSGPTRSNPNIETPSNESKRGPVDSVTDVMEHHKTHLDKIDGRERVSEEADEELNDDGESVDSDDDIEMAKHSFEEGRKEFEKQNYDQANAFLQEALKMYMELPVSRRPTCDIDEINYMLAHCAFYLKDVASAHSALLAVLANETTNTADRSAQRRTYETSHMLSQACVKLGKLEQARVSCNSALKGRKRLFGKSNEAVYESIALMARISELQGNVTQARLYERRIPASHKHIMSQFTCLTIDPIDSQLLAKEQAQQSPRSPQQLDENGAETSAGNPLGGMVVEKSTTSDSARTPSENHLSPVSNIGPIILPPPVRLPITPKERTYKFRDPQLQAWADERGYEEIGPLSLSQRKRLLTEFELMPESQIEKALAAAQDEEALKLCSARARIRSMVSRFKFSLAREMRLAVLFGVDSVVKVLLDRGVNLDAADTGGWTLLHYAAYSGSIATAEILVKAGASVEVSERKGQMAPLSIALKHDRLDICDLLYHNGAHPWREHHWKIGTPFHLACAKDILPLVQLWSHGRLDRITSAIHTVTPGLLDRRFFKFVADFDTESKILPRVVKRMKISPIGVAALMGSVHVMQWAVSKGVRIHEPCRLSETEYGEGQSTSALALAAAAGQTKMVRLLLQEQGESIQEADPVVALKMAVINRMEEAACALIEAGVRLDRQIVFWAERYDLTGFLSVATFDEGSQVTRNSRFSHIMVEQTV